MVAGVSYMLSIVIIRFGATPFLIESKDHQLRANAGFESFCEKIPTYFLGLGV